MLTLEKRNRSVRTIMVVTLFLLMAIIILLALHEVFDLFGLK